MTAEDWLAEDFDSDHWYFKRKCKYCKKDGVVWVFKNNKWILKDESTNTPHKCLKAAKVKTYPQKVCFDCGTKFGRRTPEMATWYQSSCDICKREAPCTEPRDFGGLRVVYTTT